MGPYHTCISPEWNKPPLHLNALKPVFYGAAPLSIRSWYTHWLVLRRQEVNGHNDYMTKGVPFKQEFGRCNGHGNLMPSSGTQSVGPSLLDLQALRSGQGLGPSYYLQVSESHRKQCASCSASSPLPRRPWHLSDLCVQQPDSMVYPPLCFQTAHIHVSQNFVFILLQIEWPRASVS